MLNSRIDDISLLSCIVKVSISQSQSNVDVTAHDNRNESSANPIASLSAIASHLGMLTFTESSLRQCLNHSISIFSRGK